MGGTEVQTRVGASIVLLIVYEIAKDIFMNYVVSRLSQHGIVFNKVVEFVLDYPFLSSISFFFIILGTLLILDYAQFQRRKSFVFEEPPPTQKKTPQPALPSDPIDKSFRITPVTEGKEYSNIQDYASIRVENIGNSEIHCFAKLTKLAMIDRKTIWKPYTGDKIEVFPIDTINPRGSYLQWDDGKESIVLKNGFPHTIRLVDNKASLLFFEAPSYYIFRRDILDGIFRIEIEILEFQNNKFTKLKTIKETLLVRALVQNAKLQGFHFKWEKPSRKKSVEQHET